jgi:hypothetical protein
MQRDEHTTWCRVRWRHCLRCTCDPVKRAEEAINEALRTHDDRVVSAWVVALAMSPDDIGDRCDYFVVMTKSGHIERCTRVRSMLIEGKEFIDDDDDY